jgi:hypothetical protein
VRQEEVSPFIDGGHLAFTMLSNDKVRTERMIDVELDGPHHLVAEASNAEVRLFLEQLG